MVYCSEQKCANDCEKLKMGAKNEENGCELIMIIICTLVHVICDVSKYRFSFQHLMTNSGYNFVYNVVNTNTCKLRIF